MDVDFVPGLDDLLHLLGEGVDRATEEEPSRRDSQRLKTEPPGHSVDVDAEPAQDFPRHAFFFLWWQ